MPEMSSRHLHILYISYWGIREPLGQALMVPPLLRFAEAGLRVTLVSFEKPHHLADRVGMEESHQQLRAAGIKWLPLRYHKTPTAPATAFDIAQGAARSILATLRDLPDIIHGRTFLGGLMGQMVSRVLQRPFIYHSEGFWPDEQVAGGYWKLDSHQYQITKNLELKMFRFADAVIALSQVACESILLLRSHHTKKSLVVVPSCVDLRRFQLIDRLNPIEDVLVYTGSLGGRYRVDLMTQFFRTFQSECPAVQLKIYSHSDLELVQKEMQLHGVSNSSYSVEHLPHSAMPSVVAQAQAGLHLLAPGGLYVGSPTKIGEYWACGLPVVTTPGVGDMDAIVRREKVGVIVTSNSEEAYHAAALELRALLQDPDLAQRCRRAAEEHYSLEKGVETQIELYRQLAHSKTSK